MMQQTPGMVPPPMDPQAAAAQQYQQYQPQHQQQQQYAQQQQQQYQQYQQLHQQQQQQQAAWGQQQAPDSAQPTSQEDIRTLWIGDLQFWMDESYIAACFPTPGEVVSIKVIRNKQSQQSEGYGFIEFANHAVADKVLQTYNGALMPNVEQNFKMNWAYYGAGERRADDSADYSIFVGDLAADVTDLMLQETFRSRYQSCRGAKVVIDRMTGRTKGYGFVKFADEGEQMRAMQEMNGVLCSTRPMRIGPAANKKTSNGTGSFQSNLGGGGGGAQGDSDPSNTTIFIGNLDSAVSDEILRSVFTPYGELVHVKIPVGKRCGFVQFVNRSSAEEAIRVLNGSPLCGANIRLSWGRSPSNKPDSAVGSSQPQWNGGAGYYGYAAQDPNMYGYASQPPPNMYGYGYAGYNNYPGQEQQQQQLVQQQQ